jgi:hypothetical protein
MYELGIMGNKRNLAQSAMQTMCLVNEYASPAHRVKLKDMMGEHV